MIVEPRVACETFSWAWQSKPKDWGKIISLYNSGSTIRGLSREFDCSRDSIRKRIKEELS